MTRSREVHLVSRPEGLPQASNFEIAAVELPAPGEGEVQVRNLFMSVDPYMRGRMYDRPSYAPPFKVGEAMQGGAVGEVTASNSSAFRPGDLVSSMLGWREGFNAKPELLQKLDAQGLPPQAFLGVAGMTGMTAWVGLTKIAGIKAGDTVFVSAAAGAVGQAVCQIAKIKGATVIGSAGGPDKCAWVREIGADHVIDYKAEANLSTALGHAAPKGIDVYFDNVGGEHLVAALNAARPFARFALCGMIAVYNDTKPQPGPPNLALAVGKRLRLQGFIVSDHADQSAEFAADMSAWIKAGKIKWRETIDEGIASAPGAFLKLFAGENTGKMLVKLA
ncbi:MAG: NADP-dependent oxidoreductase [Caulobacteraceae bacterium]